MYSVSEYYINRRQTSQETSKEAVSLSEHESDDIKLFAIWVD